MKKSNRVKEVRQGLKDFTWSKRVKQGQRVRSIERISTNRTSRREGMFMRMKTLLSPLKAVMERGGCSFS